MRCTRPLTVGFKSDGKTLSWSSKKYNKEYAPFQLPCGKCISCKLLQAREKATRCVHEASLYEKNSFITLTYSDENLESDRLIYEHAQKFMRDLRYAYPENPIPSVITGEYGGKNKRPHFHILLFNFSPGDEKPYKKNKQGDQLYKSDKLDDIWSRNDKTLSPTLVGPINLSTAGYVCRYQLKKLEHEGEADLYKPIVKYSSKYAIGKAWIEKNWKETFKKGYVQINKKEILKIPRYYENWLKKNHPEQYADYICNIKIQMQSQFRKIAEKEELLQRQRDFKRSQAKGYRMTKEKSQNKMREEILEQKTELIKTQEI